MFAREWLFGLGRRQWPKFYGEPHAKVSGSPYSEISYNIKGQSIRSVDPDGVAYLFSYNYDGALCEKYRGIAMKTKRLVATKGVDETGESEEFTWDLFPVVDSTDTAHLDEGGLAKVGTEIREGMIVVGKWGKTKSFNHRQLPNTLELHGLPRAELLSKFGHYWRNTSLYADASMTGVVTKAFMETVGHEVRAVIELNQPD